MIRKELTLETPYNRFSSLVSRPAQSSSRPRGILRMLEQAAWVKAVARYFSSTLEEEVSPRRALRILHAQTAVFALLFPVDIPFLCRMVCLVWAVCAFKKCRIR